MAKKTKPPAGGSIPQPAADLAAFIDASPSPFHAVLESARRLEAAGFTRLLETDPWPLAANKRGAHKHYVVREDSSIIAFVLGTGPVEENGFVMIGAHTDSPCLKLKPQPNRWKEGFAQLNCEVYGGAITATWADRDLFLAGRVITTRKRRTQHHFVRLDSPRLRIANLAIHLNRSVNDDGLILNPQTQLVPLLGLAEKKGDIRFENLLADAVGESADDIVGFDLCLADAVPSAFGGIDNAFLFAPRLDNLASSHAALCAMIDTCDEATPNTRLIALFDHEEVGSTSAQGAGSPFLRDTLTRLSAHSTSNVGAHERYARAMAHSFFISADMAHGVHPSYSDLHEPHHMPMLGRGPVIKTNSNQRYATSGASAARFVQLAQAAKVSVQRFVTRSDLGCGSTIGPITAGELGCTTVDVGNPMLSMHSVREMCAAADVASMIAVMSQAFR